MTIRSHRIDQPVIILMEMALPESGNTGWPVAQLLVTARKCQLSLEDMKGTAIHYGFELEVSHITLSIISIIRWSLCELFSILFGEQLEKTIETTDTTNPRSMMQHFGQCARNHWWLQV
nr:hypothetical protein [Tanacetum cinerariifolium]